MNIHDTLSIIIICISIIILIFYVLKKQKEDIYQYYEKEVYQYSGDDLESVLIRYHAKLATDTQIEYYLKESNNKKNNFVYLYGFKPNRNTPFILPYDNKHWFNRPS